MNTGIPTPRVRTLALAISVALGLGVAGSAFAYTSPTHVFSVDDVMSTYDGATYGGTGALTDKTIICGLVTDPSDPAYNPCPADAAQPYTDKSGVTLYPVDSEFGAYVVDFVGAQPKSRDSDYGEGWVGNLPDGAGLAVSNAVTDRYKVKAPQGTWCQGLGGNSVKCSTEHYTVMEHVLSCHEVIPYFYADPETGEQGTQETPDGSLSIDCATTDLDDEQIILVGGLPTTRLTSSVPGDQMDANDKTSVLDDISVSADYAVTLKDDGKALYRWGALTKFPNDVRMYARLQLPDEWKERDADGNLVNDFKVTRAVLIVNHTITNNPNDQLRPEDLENEAAIGVKPDHTVENEGTENEVWRSTKLCYEGDGDVIDTEEGFADPTAIGVGTYFKNGPFAITEAPTGLEPGADPYPFSSDLRGALTNAWFTTIDREPFEWAYVKETIVDGVKTVDYFGCPYDVDHPEEAEIPTNGAEKCADVPADAALYSGPRWRLKPNKFGQDLPGLEIPTTAALNQDCSPPPFDKSLIKYEVGVDTTTVINLLDWADENGPLATSKGWVDTALYNDFRPIVDEVVDENGDVRQISDLGSPMSEDFDVMVYIKGDRKPVFLYDMKLIVEYEGEEPPPPPEDEEVDLRLAQLSVPFKIWPTVRTRDLVVKACNDSGVAADGTIELTGVSDPDVGTANFSQAFSGLAVGACTKATFTWTAPDDATTVTWTAEVVAGTGFVDVDTSNNTRTATTTVTASGL